MVVSSGYPEVGRISDLMLFEPDSVSVQLYGKQLRLAPRQIVIPCGPDRDLTVAEVLHKDLNRSELRTL